MIFLGDEDHLGDMDFKVTGTREGICGVQMDIKVDGLRMDSNGAGIGAGTSRKIAYSGCDVQLHA